MPRLRKVLVANRGEIAIRIMRACRELDLRTVAVYSAADASALHTKYADEAHPIGPSPASESYLNIPRILEVAERTRADALHPGYGFLAESAAFARACEERGIVFVGPPARVLEAVGSKLAARKAMAKAGVPTIPGSEALESVEEAVGAAEALGWPVVLKPSGGGGGKGMRVVRDRKELGEAFENTRALAKSAFADPAVYIEKFLPRPRHIEVQILADRKGTTLHLFERECSLQRRFQKFMEEAPSPLLTPEKRRWLTALAVRAAKSVKYSGAGTLEFLWSGGRFHFGEVNPRLQVEHGVTEMVTGVDIVKAQLRIASGQPLGLRQAGVLLRGHAIECRIMAEDPVTHAPSPGTIQAYRSPGGVGVRVDSGVHMGYTIPSFYDSLIAKLTVWGNDRPEAVARLRRALYEYIIEGVRTNIPLCKAVVAHPAFRRGDLSTDFLERNRIAEQVRSVQEMEQAKALQMASIFAEGRERAVQSAVAMTSAPAEPEKEEFIVVATAVQRYLETERGDGKPVSKWLLEARRESVEGD